MKEFDELVEIYDEALKKARAKLSEFENHPYPRIQIPVMLETSISVKVEAEMLPPELNPPMLVFEFERNETEGWVLINK